MGSRSRYNPHSRGVAQLVARVVRDDEVAGSSPVTPTIQTPTPLIVPKQPWVPRAEPCKVSVTAVAGNTLPISPPPAEITLPDLSPLAEITLPGLSPPPGERYREGGVSSYLKAVRHTRGTLQEFPGDSTGVSVELYVVRGHSMTPTFSPGDRLLVSRTRRPDLRIARGDLVVVS